MSTSKLAHTYISAVLKWGSYLSLAMLLSGLILLAFLRPELSPLSNIKTLSFGQLASGLSRFDVIALINFGLLVLMFTPILRVIVAVFSFIIEKDLKYALVASGVLLILLFSLFVAR